MRAALTVALAYLLGSIPFGYLIVRLQAGADVRESGSGGTGATNVTRSAGKAAGLLTLLLDAVKGIAAVLLAATIVGVAVFPGLTRGSRVPYAEWWVAAAGLVVLVGHVFPIWLGFRGGKGVATAVGVFLVVAPIALVFAGLLFLLTVGFSRYVSLGSLVAAAAFPLLVLLQHLFAPVPGLSAVIVLSLAAACLIVFAHRGNLRRLLEGTESKFS
jgi:acyl phosphate:glycerol-3-phosphate acyltransferase